MDPHNMSTNNTPQAQYALIVEDEQAISNLLKLHLLENNFKVDQSYTGEAALEALSTKKYDLCLLDWMLPGAVQGIDLLKKIRQHNSNLGIIMVTAKADPESIVEGIEAGADDYLTKPFDARVLLARVKNLLRHRPDFTGAANHELARQESANTLSSKQPSEKQQATSHVGNKVSHDGLEIDFEKYLVIYQNEEVHLTPSEFKLLSSLVKARGKVLTRDQLIDQIQGEDVSVTGRTIDTHIFALRKKLKDWSEYIETIRGVGYRILVDSNYRTESEM